MHPSVEHAKQRLYNLKPAARVAFRKHIRALNHHCANDSFGKRLADTTRMRANQVDLKLTKFLCWDGDFGKRAESCIYSINDFASRDNIFNNSSGPFDASPRTGGE